MDGLECSEVFYSSTKENKDVRIDSQFYTTEIKHNIYLEYCPIGRYLISTQYGVSKDMNVDGNGYPAYRMNEIHHSLCDLTTEKYVELTDKEFEEVKLNNRDVLFNRTNSFELVGRTGVYYDNSIPQTFASYLVRLVPDNLHIYSEYLAAFLNTQIGIQEIRRRARQSINQTNVNPEEVKAIEIPLLKREFQESIRKCYENAHQLRKDSFKKYDEADTILAQTIGIEKTNVVDDSISTKLLSASFLTSGRLDAEYYQPKYDNLFAMLDKLPTERLGNIVNMMKSIEPGSEYYGDEGVPFIRVGDVSAMGINTPSIKIPKTTVPSIENLYPKKDTILFSKDGSVGIAYKLEEDVEAVTSGALLHFRVKDSNNILPDYLTLALNSEIVQLQAERDTSGAIIQHWKPSDIANVIIPILPYEEQCEISEKVQESFALRRDAEKLISVAVKAVEIAIETDESVAIDWLKKQVSETSVENK